ncbi:MAG: hypothetical protein ACK55I_03525, partial [bacterium]
PGTARRRARRPGLRARGARRRARDPCGGPLRAARHGRRRAARCPAGRPPHRRPGPGAPRHRRAPAEPVHADRPARRGRRRARHAPEGVRLRQRPAPAHQRVRADARAAGGGLHPRPARPRRRGPFRRPPVTLLRVRRGR